MLRSRNRPPMIAGGGLFGEVSTVEHGLRSGHFNWDRGPGDVWVSLGNGKAIKVPSPTSQQAIDQAVEMAVKSHQLGKGRTQSFGTVRKTSSAPDVSMLVSNLLKLARHSGGGEPGWYDEVEVPATDYPGKAFGTVHNQLVARPASSSVPSDRGRQGGDMQPSQNNNQSGESQWSRHVWDSVGPRRYSDLGGQASMTSAPMAEQYIGAAMADRNREIGVSASPLGRQGVYGGKAAGTEYIPGISQWYRNLWDDGRSIYGGSPMGSAQRNAQDQARSARVAQERMQQEPDVPVRSMGDELNARSAAINRPSSIADSGFGGSRATSAAQAEGGGGGSFNKYAATLQAVRAGYPDVWSMMVGDKTPRLAFGQNRAAHREVQREVVRFASEIERRWKEYLANGGQLDMAGFINKYDYPQNREAYIEQRAKEDNIARGVRAGQR